ncbi:hypothetical protein IG631_11472 [Alternaria alternata]|nr:hypothetical protein IG631_11472 [Alternaria alternata]
MCWEAMGLVDRLFIDSPLVAETAALCGSGSPVYTPASTTHSRMAIRPREKQPKSFQTQIHMTSQRSDSSFWLIWVISVFSEIHRNSLRLLCPGFGIRECVCQLHSGMSIAHQAETPTAT